MEQPVEDLRDWAYYGPFSRPRVAG